MKNDETKTPQSLKPLISVIITSYNQRNFLEKTIQSVLDQTYESIEIIVADDFSTDDTDEYINQIKENSRFPINYLKQERNVGIPKNRNTALKQIKGEYFTILDGDDLYKPENIERMIEKINSGYEAVYTNIDFIDENDLYIRTRDKNVRPEGKITYNIGLGMFGIMRNMIFPSNIIHKAGMMDKRLPRYDGYDFTFKFSLHCKVGYIPEALAQYRVHINSDSRQLKPIDHYNDFLQIRRNINKYLKYQNTLSKDQINDIENYWNKRLFEYWLKLPRLKSVKFRSFSESIILASLLGPLSLFKAYPELEIVFESEKQKPKI